MLSDEDINILNGCNIKWESQRTFIATMTFCFACCDYFNNIKDMNFINNEIPTNMEKFHQLSDNIKNRYVNICKSHIHYFDNMDNNALKLLTEKNKNGKLDEQYQISLKFLDKDYERTIKEIKSWIIRN